MFSATMIPASILLPIGLFLAGWSAENKLHWIATDIVRLILILTVEILKTFFGVFLQGIAFIGAGMIVAFQSIQTYVIDGFTLHAASGKTTYFS